MLVSELVTEENEASKEKAVRLQRVILTPMTTVVCCLTLVMVLWFTPLLKEVIQAIYLGSDE